MDRTLNQIRSGAAASNTDLATLWMLFYAILYYPILYYTIHPELPTQKRSLQRGIALRPTAGLQAHQRRIWLMQKQVLIFLSLFSSFFDVIWWLMSSLATDRSSAVLKISANSGGGYVWGVKHGLCLSTETRFAIV